MQRARLCRFYKGDSRLKEFHELASAGKKSLAISFREIRKNKYQRAAKFVKFVKFVVKKYLRNLNK